MVRLLQVICGFVKDVFNVLSETVADGIEERDGKKVTAYTLLIVLWAIACLAVCLLILFLTYQFLPIILVGAFICAIIYGLFHMDDNNDVDTEDPDDVEDELLRQRASEMYDEIHALMFNAIQGAAGITPLLRPHDPYEVETSSPRGEHFYIVSVKNDKKQKRVPIYQFECDLETQIDKLGEDTIQRELQRYVTKYAPRYPMVMSAENGGRAPLQVIDIKALGGHVLIEAVQATKASISLIDARHRARTERQRRSADIYDRDF